MGGGGGGGASGPIYEKWGGASGPICEKWGGGKCTKVLKKPCFHQICTGVYGRVVLEAWNRQIDPGVFCFINKA